MNQDQDQYHSFEVFFDQTASPCFYVDSVVAVVSNLVSQSAQCFVQASDDKPLHDSRLSWMHMSSFPSERVTIYGFDPFALFTIQVPVSTKLTLFFHSINSQPYI